MNKKSRFSYIIPFDVPMRIIVYNCSNWASLEDTIHNDIEMIVEVLDNGMIFYK